MTKKIVISILSIIMLMSSVVLVNADDSVASIGIALNKTQYNPGDIVVVTVTVNCEGGISGVNAKYTYNNSILEYVSSGVKDSSKFSSISSNPGDITVIYIGGETEKTGNIFEITFKVKENVSAGTKADVLELTNIAVEDKTAVQKVSLANASADITVAGIPEQPSGNENTNGTPSGNENTNKTPSGNENTNKTPSGNGNTNGTPSDKDKTTVQTGKLPQTGISGILPMAIITIIAITAGTYMSYRKYKNM